MPILTFPLPANLCYTPPSARILLPGGWPNDALSDTRMRGRGLKARLRVRIFLNVDVPTRLLCESLCTSVPDRRSVS